MSPELTGFAGLMVFFVLVALRLPIGFALTIVGYVGSCYLTSMRAGEAILGSSPISTAASYTLSVIPLFVLMSELALAGGLTKEMYKAVHNWLGNLRGGLCFASIAACAGFAAICGSSIATAVTIGKVALPEMKKLNYEDRIATGTIAAGGTLGIMIPPSLSFVLYGVITEQSIGKLFIAGILPGILLASLFILTIFILLWRDPSRAPATGSAVSWSEKLKSALRSWAAGVLFLVVIGGIWVGFFTPTEAAAVGCFLAFVFGMIQKRLTREGIIQAFRNTARTTGMMFILVIGAMVFNYFMALSLLPMVMADWVKGLALSRYAILAVIFIIYLILGCLMDTLSMIVLTLPVIFPVVMALGFDPIWFGVLMTLLAEAALITPPVGMNVFVVAGISEGVPMETVFRGIFPFFSAMIICLVILVLFPQISLFLPGFMR